MTAAPRRPLAVGDLRGDLQMHTNWSDGAATADEMVAACAARGYEYLAITDHSQALRVAGGLDRRRLRLQARHLEVVRERHPGIHVLHGVEVEILRDGALDLDDETLIGLDLVVAAIHTHLRLAAGEQTRRLLTALAHPAVHLLAHPTCRKLPGRPPIELDLEAVLGAAVEHGVAVECNALPARLDLGGDDLARAAELGAMVAIDSDAHSVHGLGVLEHGVAEARRAGVGTDRVLNALPLDRLLAVLRRRA